jgi:hypothetical protein
VECPGIACRTPATLGEIDGDEDLAKRQMGPPHKLYTGSHGFGTMRSDFSEIERQFRLGVLKLLVNGVLSTRSQLAQETAVGHSLSKATA